MGCWSRRVVNELSALVRWSSSVARESVYTMSSIRPQFPHSSEQGRRCESGWVAFVRVEVRGRRWVSSGVRRESSSRPSQFRPSLPPSLSTTPTTRLPNPHRSHCACLRVWMRPAARLLGIALGLVRSRCPPTRVVSSPTSLLPLSLKRTSTFPELTPPPLA